MKIRYLLAGLLLSALPVTVAHAGVFISIAPPPLVTYDQPVCPTEGYLWTPGYWAYDYDASNYYWVNGVWVPPPQVGFLWTPGYWGFNNGGYAFNTGYWGPTIGFYGGINYGYGYGGYGYYGGRWDGRVFRYNTAVTHVNVNSVHNTYVDRNVIRNSTNSRASFNGRGGINARPDAAQLAASRGHHAGPVSAQTRALTRARTAHAGAPQPNSGRNRTASVTPHGRTADLAHSNLATRNNRGVTNPSRSNGRSLAPTTTRTRGTTAPRTALTHGRSGTRSPQISRASRGARTQRVTRQPRAPQPRSGGGNKTQGKKH